MPNLVAGNVASDHCHEKRRPWIAGQGWRLARPRARLGCCRLFLQVIGYIDDYHILFSPQEEAQGKGSLVVEQVGNPRHKLGKPSTDPESRIDVQAPIILAQRERLILAYYPSAWIIIG
jgi:hypothetical protein